MNETFTPYDTVDYLKTEEDMLAYLDACLEEGDPHLVTHALEDIARARGMINLAQADTDNNLKTKENPSFSEVFNMAKALGFSLHATMNHA